jgi:hypothetical protein
MILKDFGFFCWGFLEDYIFVWWNVWVSINSSFALRKILSYCKWQGHNVMINWVIMFSFFLKLLFLLFISFFFKHLQIKVFLFWTSIASWLSLFHYCTLIVVVLSYPFPTWVHFILFFTVFLFFLIYKKIHISSYISIYGFQKNSKLSYFVSMASYYFPC